MKTISKLRSPIHYFGGKGIMISKLLQYISEHRIYCEVFGGGASLLFAKEPSEIEVYNDLDSNLVNLFRVLRDEEKFEKFYDKKVCLTPYSREEWQSCKETYNIIRDDIERAYRFFVAIRQGFSGLIERS